MNGRFIANDDHELKKKQSELLLANIQGHFFFILGCIRLHQKKLHFYDFDNFTFLFLHSYSKSSISIHDMGQNNLATNFGFKHEYRFHEKVLIYHLDPSLL